MFTTVIFTKDNSTEGVPLTWIVEVDGSKYCMWPEHLNLINISKLIKKCAPPKLSWTKYECRIKSRSENYSEMLKDCKEAEIISTENQDSDNADEATDTDAESSGDEIPSPPKKKSKSCYDGGK